MAYAVGAFCVSRAPKSRKSGKFPVIFPVTRELGAEILSTWNYLAPEVEGVPSSYDLKSDAWSFGKTVLEIARWSTVSRVMSLTGANAPTQSGGPYGIEAAIRTLLANDSTQRVTIAEALNELQTYFELAHLASQIPKSNFDKMMEDIRAFDITISGPVKQQKMNIDKEDLIAQVHDIEASPETHFSIDHSCPKCGSPLTVVLASYDSTPFEDYQQFGFLFGCFGRKDRPCGLYRWSYA
ncbi:MAG TPA: hypothetical protein VMI47_11025 [Pseudolabrys sp.]|nr:hypothetical protein [Pseudolabrys sp.]